jgi:hypothetical protein
MASAATATGRPLTAPCGCQYHTGSHEVVVSPDCKEHAAKPKPSIVQRFQRSTDERALEKKLAFNLNACRCHDSNGLKPGHAAFKLLYQNSIDLLQEFSAKWGDSMEMLYAKYPAMYVLKAKAADLPKGTVQPAPGLKFNPLTWGIRLAILIPILLLIGRVIYHYGSRMLGM